MERNLKRPHFQERRGAPRFDVFYGLPTLKSISRVGGHEVTLINISRLGALIESRERMRPNSRIVLRAITAEATYIFKGRITRCIISPGRFKVFQAGIEFDEEFTFLPMSIELLNLFKDDEDFLR